jgi:hypothetical protein
MQRGATPSADPHANRATLNRCELRAHVDKCPDQAIPAERELQSALWLDAHRKICVGLAKDHEDNPSASRGQAS